MSRPISTCSTGYETDASVGSMWSTQRPVQSTDTKTKINSKGQFVTVIVPSVNSDRVRNSRSSTAAGLSTDMTRRSRDINIVHATADERRDIHEHAAPFPSRDELIGIDHTKLTSPRPLHYKRNTRRTPRNDLHAFPAHPLDAADQGIGSHTVEPLLLPPQVAPRGWAMPKKLEKPSRPDDTFTPRFGQYAIRPESVDSLSLPIQRETTQVVGTGPLEPTEEMLRQNGINSSTQYPKQQQFATFQNQSPAVQQKTIQTYAVNLQQQQQQKISAQAPTGAEVAGTRTTNNVPMYITSSQESGEASSSRDSGQVGEQQTARQHLESVTQQLIDQGFGRRQSPILRAHMGSTMAPGPHEGHFTINQQPYGIHDPMGMRYGLPPGLYDPRTTITPSYNAQAPDAADFGSLYNAEGMAALPPSAMRGPGGPNATQQTGGSNHALQDLMLLEQQNKKRLMMARQEQDGGNSMPMPRDGPGGPGGPGAPPGPNAPFQGASLSHLGRDPRDPRDPRKDPSTILSGLSEFPAPRNSREHPQDISDSQQSYANNSAMFKVPLARQKAKLPGYGRDNEPKDNEPKSTTNVTISRDHTKDIEAECLRILGSKMKGWL